MWGGRSGEEACGAMGEVGAEGFGNSTSWWLFEKVVVESGWLQRRGLSGPWGCWGRDVVGVMGRGQKGVARAGVG